MALNLLDLSLYIAVQFMVTCIKCLLFSSKQTIHSQLIPRDIGVKLSHLSKKQICIYCTRTCIFLFVALFLEQLSSVVRQGLLLLQSDGTLFVIPFKIVICKFYFWSYCGILILIPLKVDPIWIFCFKSQIRETCCSRIDSLYSTMKMKRIRLI